MKILPLFKSKPQMRNFLNYFLSKKKEQMIFTLIFIENFDRIELFSS